MSIFPPFPSFALALISLFSKDNPITKPSGLFIVILPPLAVPNASAEIKLSLSIRNKSWIVRVIFAPSALSPIPVSAVNLPRSKNKSFAVISKFPACPDGLLTVTLASSPMVN